MSFVDEVRHYVNQSHANAWRRAGDDVPDEPALVSSFLSEEMYRSLCKILVSWRGGMSTIVKGIFTHQTPKVRLLTQAHSTEIADLMLVHQHFTMSHGEVVDSTGRTLLLQAKRTGAPLTGSVASGTAALQFELYRDWAPFEGVSRLDKGPSGCGSWDFRSSSAAPATAAAVEGAYLTVFNQQAFSMNAATPQWQAPIAPGPAHGALCSAYPADCTWSQGIAPSPGTPASAGVACPTDFGTAFEEFLDGKRGRPFKPGVLTGADHWSIFVNTMLRVSAGSGSYLYNSKNQGVRSAPRGRTLLFDIVAPILGHVAIEEVRSFLAGEPQNPASPFLFTNSLLRAAIGESRTGDCSQPPNDGPEFDGASHDGHPPMLVVATLGEENALPISG